MLSLILFIVKMKVLHFMNSVQENKLLFKQSIDLLDTYQTLNVAIKGLTF